MNYKKSSDKNIFKWNNQKQLLNLQWKTITNKLMVDK